MTEGLVHILRAVTVSFNLTFRDGSLLLLLDDVSLFSCILLLNMCTCFTNTYIHLLYLFLHLSLICCGIRKRDYFAEILCNHVQVHLNKLECRGKVNLFQ